MTSSPVSRVRVGGLVLLKVIKHCQEDFSLDEEGVNGILLGLAVDDTLEITNSFAIPRTSDNEASFESLHTYECDMIKNLRQVNSDYFSVGFYQAITGGGYFISRSNLDSIYQYFNIAPESIMLAYDPTMVSRGQLGFRAFRLSADLIKAMSDHEQKTRINGPLKALEAAWECDAAVNGGKVNFTRLLEELPVEIHNSPLVNVMLHDMVSRQDKVITPQNIPAFALTGACVTDIASDVGSGLDLNTAASMEQQLKSLLSGLDVIHDLQYNYQRKLVGMGKVGPQDARNRDLAPIRLDTALVSAQLNNACTNLSRMAGQTVGKLMLTQAVHPPLKGKVNLRLD